MRRIDLHEIPTKYPGALEWFDVACEHMVEHVVRFYERAPDGKVVHLVAIASIEGARSLLNLETIEATWVAPLGVWSRHAATIATSPGPLVATMQAGDELIEVGDSAYLGSDGLVYEDADDEYRPRLGTVRSVERQGAVGEWRDAEDAWRPVVTIDLLENAFTHLKFLGYGVCRVRPRDEHEPPTKWSAHARDPLDVERAARRRNVEVVQ